MKAAVRYLTLAIAMTTAQSFAIASDLLAEIRSAKENIVGTTKLVPGQQLWGIENNKKLLSTISGTWIDLAEADLSDKAKFVMGCATRGLVFESLNDYSFKRFYPLAKYRVESLLIFRNSTSYSVRNNVEQGIKAFGDYGPNFHKVLLNANSTSTLMLLSPNVLLEVDLNSGVPTLWGRCQ
jgi:hypothetical protein